MKRDEGGPKVCHYCGVWMTKPASRSIPTTRTVDHIVPRGRGGPNAKRNLVPCCASCNGLKGPLRSACTCGWCAAAWATYGPDVARWLGVREELAVREVPGVELVLLAVWAQGDGPVLGPSPRRQRRKARQASSGGGSPLSKVWGGHEKGWI